MNYFDTTLSQVQTEHMLTSRGLPLGNAVLLQAGIFPIEYPYPVYDRDTHTLAPDGDPIPNAEGTAYVQRFVVVDLPLDVALKNVKTPKFAEFDAIFLKLDALKIRPAASIAEALSKGQTPDPGDVYVLSETQAVTEENRRRRDLVEAANTVEAVRAVSVWWPEEGVERAKR